MKGFSLQDAAFVKAAGGSGTSGILAIDSVVTAWAGRVVSNGGAALSGSTINAVDQFWKALKTANLDSRIYAVNVFAPDSWIAALTPLKVNAGPAIWSDPAGELQGFNLDPDRGIGSGLTGDMGHHLETGLDPAVIWPSGTSAGVSILVPQVSTDYGDICASVHPDFDNFKFVNDLTGMIGIYPDNQVNGGSLPAFASMSIKSGALSLYMGSSGGGFSLADSNTDLIVPVVWQGGYPVWIFDANQGGSGETPTDCTMSFFAMHDGLTQAETQTLFNAVQALRVSLGGGSV